MNINKAVKIEIEKFKNASDTLMISEVEKYQFELEEKINNTTKHLEDTINNIYATGDFEFETLLLLHGEIESINNKFKDFDSFCYPLVMDMFNRIRPENDLILEKFQDSLVYDCRVDRRRLILETKKVCHYQKRRMFDQLVMIGKFGADMAMKKMNMNLDLYNGIIDRLDEIFGDEFDGENLDVTEKQRKEKVTDVKKMIEIVESRGYKIARKTGSHLVYKNDKGDTTVIPYHTNKDFHTGLGYAIQKQIGI